MLFEAALDVETAQQRRKIKRRPVPRMPGAARRAQPDRLLEIVERNARLLGNPSARGGGVAAADLARFEQHRFDPGRGERIRGGAAGQAATDDDDRRGFLAAMTRVGAQARFREAVDPGGAAVSGHLNIIADLFRAGGAGRAGEAGGG